MAQRPLSSDVDVICDGEASRLTARMLAPLIGRPFVSLTVPVALADWARAEDDRKTVRSTPTTSRKPDITSSSRTGRFGRRSSRQFYRRRLVTGPSVEPVKHQVNHDACDRYIDPHGEGPACNPDVAVELRPAGRGSP